ncbi:MAG: hypothetical protein LBM64_01655 [Deltaproteobacteria bacterium]|jgi:hypothetical protein|nr:hypothetical protein [Deltaproteobacteria bacterium]
MFNTINDGLLRFCSEYLPLPLSAVSNETAASIRDSALNSVHMEVLLRGGLVAGAVLLLFCIFTIIRYFLSSRKAFVPAGWITLPRQVRALLNGALEQRSTLELQFNDSRNQRRPVLRCSLEEVGAGRVGIEAYGINNIVAGWIGREISCYFKLKIKDQSVYYTFDSTVESVEARPRGVSALWLSFPTRMQNRQKRAFLRISPPMDYFLGAAVWFGRNLPADGNLGNIALWPKPSLTLLPGKERQFFIRDLSAGGVRLWVPRREKDARRHDFNLAEQMALLLDLFDPDNSRRLRYWLLCRVQNLITDFNDQSFDIGLQFLAWAAPKEDGSSLEWLKLTREKEVAPLGNWIMHRHLEIFRANPDLK